MSNESRVHWMTIAWAVSGIALFATTCRLWIRDSLFPVVPLVSWGEPLNPAQTSFYVLMGTLAGVLLVTAATTLTSSAAVKSLAVPAIRILIAVHCGYLVMQFIANQHCLQPWAYLAVIIGCVLIFAEAQLAVRLLRIVTIAIYLYSAVSKLDHQFVVTLGQRFLYSSLGLINLTPNDWSPAVQTATILTFPLVELVVAIGLIWGRSRRLAIGLACLMHLGLIVILGSVFLEQQPAVRIWNAFFLIQIFLLFARPKETPPQDEADPERNGDGILQRVSQAIAIAITAAAVLLPLLEPLGMYDHWPSWGLYAPRNSRVIVFVEEDAVEKLPPPCREALVPARFEDPDFETPAYRMSLNHWSLMKLHVPAYPQDRFQLGSALAVAEIYELGNKIHVQLQSKSNRLTGEREKEMIDGVEALREAAERFRLNAIPKLPKSKSEH